MPFEIVWEPEEYLYEALARLKTEINLPGSIRDMAIDIMRTAIGVTSAWDNNAWADTERNSDLLRPIIEETEKALRDHVKLKSAREARQLAKSIWSARRNRRGRDHEIDPDLLRAVLEAVERLAGRRLTYSRKRARRALLGRPTTGPPEGAMLDVVVAALDWAYAFPTAQQKSSLLKVEGVLSAIKRLRRQPGQN
jgi:hypothetical protein